MHTSRFVRVVGRQIHLSAGHGTVNSSEIAHFSRLSSQWWDEQGEFSLLHKMNPVRVQFVRQKLLEISRERDEEHISLSEVLHGLDVLDVGCGGGLLSEVRCHWLIHQSISTCESEPGTSWGPYDRDRRVGIQHHDC
jgi:2-polyprenyl-6-hydroxyphenyl methylase/3-demethylubiquinone-9 3-methyltransferase